MKNHQPNIKLNINKISLVGGERCMCIRTRMLYMPLALHTKTKKKIQHNELHLRKV